MDNKNIKIIRNVIKIGFSIFFFIILFFVCIKFVPGVMQLLVSGDEEAMEIYIKEHSGASGIVILVLLQVLQTITIFFPGIPIYMCAGIVFGKLKGFVICYITYVCSNVGVFMFSRKMSDAADALLRDDKESKVSELLAKTKHPARIIGALCVLPIIPNGLIPHVAAKSTLDLKHFAGAVSIGCIPGIILFVVCGDLLLSEYFWLIIGLMILALILMVLAFTFKEQLTNLCNKIFEKVSGN